MSAKNEESDQPSDLKDRDLVQDVGTSDQGIDNEDNDRPVRVGRKRDFGFLPIPKSKRHDPNLKTHEQFQFTWRMNLILAGAAVRAPPFCHRTAGVFAEVLDCLCLEPVLRSSECQATPLRSWC